MTGESLSRGLLFLSNGHGEDSIAAEIIRQLPGGGVEAYPLIGAGTAYANVGPIVGPRASVASGGWRNVRGSLARDVATGGLGILPKAVQFLRRTRGRYAKTIVVGDMVGIYLAAAAGLRDVIYLDVYKTGFGASYSALDKLVLKRVVRCVFCRHEMLAAALRAAKIDARARGNVMMDTVPRGDYQVETRRQKEHAVTLLPGSRELTVESFALQVEALRRLSIDVLPDIFAAVAGSVDIEALGRATRLQRSGPMTAEADDLGTLADQRLTIHLARGAAMGNLIDGSDFVLSQAGTATVQALGLGRPAITFRNRRDRVSRFRAESALFGEARLVVPADADIIAGAVQLLLADAAERVRLGLIGRERIGSPGAIEEILKEIGR